MIIDWGSVPEWVSGVGAAAALVFAGAAAMAARRTVTLQNEQIEQLKIDNARREDTANRALAVGISAWARITRSNDGALAQVHFVNTSKLPAYELAIYLFTPAKSIIRYYEVTGPTEGRVIRLLTERLHELYPEDHQGWRDASVRPQVSCSFRDAGGNWWYRDTQGRLFATAAGEDAATAARKSGPSWAGEYELMTDAPLNQEILTPREGVE